MSRTVGRDDLGLFSKSNPALIRHRDTILQHCQSAQRGNGSSRPHSTKNTTCDEQGLGASSSILHTSRDRQYTTQRPIAHDDSILNRVPVLHWLCSSKKNLRIVLIVIFVVLLNGLRVWRLWTSSMQSETEETPPLR